MLSTRVAAVAAAVPPLGNILARALATSASTQQATARKRKITIRPEPSAPSSSPRFRDVRGSSASARRLALLEPDHVPEGAREIPVGSGPAPILDPDTEGKVDPAFRDTDVKWRRPGKERPFLPARYPTPENSVDKSLAEPVPFSHFDMNPGLLDSLLARYGESSATTPIQSLAFSQLLNRTEKGTRTVLGAETGSGKTLAYLVPLMSDLKRTEPEVTDQLDRFEPRLFPRSIIITPTHELTRQTTGMAKQLTHGIKLSAEGFSSHRKGGVYRGGPVDMLFSTPAMLRRMFAIRKPGLEVEEGYEAREWVMTDRVEWVVVDEADILLSKDFKKETLTMLKHILDKRPNAHVVLNTATFPPALLSTIAAEAPLNAKSFTHLLSPSLHKLPRNLEAVFVPRSTNTLIADVTHEVRRILADDAVKRNQMLASGMKVDKSKIIVFCNQDSKAELLSKAFEARDLPNLTWTSFSKNRRYGTQGELKSFLLDPKVPVEEAMSISDDQSPRILITTGVLSRGLDFSPLVSTVVLVDQPSDIMDFMHRAGRAGRAGRKGRVVIFGWGQGEQATAGPLGQMVRDVVGPESSSRYASGRNQGGFGMRESSGRSQTAKNRHRVNFLKRDSGSKKGRGE